MSLSTEEKELVQQSFAQILPIAEQVADLFYDRLFQLDPDLRPLFKSDMVEQQKKLIQTLEIAVQELNNLSVLIPVLQRLAIRHVDYGVRNEHYDTVGEALIWTLEQGLARYVYRRGAYSLGRVIRLHLIHHERSRYKHARK